MTRLPAVSAREVVRALGRISYEADHQTGSHIILRNPKLSDRRLVVPNHTSVAKGTLRSIIRDAQLTVEEFVSSLHD